MTPRMDWAQQHGKRARTLVLVAVALAAFAWTVEPSSVAQADAGKETKLRVVALGPSGTSWHRAFRAWGGSLQRDTDGRVSMQVIPGRVGQERQAVAQLKSGKVSGAMLSAVGLMELCPEVLVMQAPGLVRDATTWSKVSAALERDLQQACKARGYLLSGVSTLGQARLFAKSPIGEPDAWKATVAANQGDVLVSSWATGFPKIRVKVMKIEGFETALKQGKVDLVPGSSIAAFYLGWYKHVSYVSDPPGSYLVSATLLREDAVAGLDSPTRTTLLNTGSKAHAWLDRQVKKEDDAAYQKILQSGVKVSSIRASEGAWKQKTEQARAKLPRVAKAPFSQALLAKAEAAAK